MGRTKDRPRVRAVNRHVNGEFATNSKALPSTLDLCSTDDRPLRDADVDVVRLPLDDAEHALGDRELQRDVLASTEPELRPRTQDEHQLPRHVASSSNLREEIRIRGEHATEDERRIERRL